MEKMAAQAPQTTVDSLARLKESIVRCMALVGASAEEGSLATEESLYLREAVRRYIPDSINSCLRVPQKDRASLVIDGSKPALDLLHDQLQMIQQQLDAREAKLTQFAGEALLRQQRFLAAKANGSRCFAAGPPQSVPTRLGGYVPEPPRWRRGPSDRPRVCHARSWQR
jgi:hypothetical protein